MSGDFYFDDFRILPDSPLLNPKFKHLGLKAGDYCAKWDASKNVLLIAKQRVDANQIQIPLTLEQLMLVLMTVNSGRDKFTPEEREAAENVVRKRSPYVGEGVVSHHVIPLTLFKKNKLAVKAVTRECGFNEDIFPNRITVPLFFHKGSHPVYTDYVDYVLEGEWSVLIDQRLEGDCSAVLYILNEVIYYLRDKIDGMIKNGQVTRL